MEFLRHKRKGQLWFRYNYGNGILEASKTTDGGLFLTITEDKGTPQGIYIPREYVSNIAEWLKKAYPAKGIADVVKLAGALPISSTERDPGEST